MSGLARRGGARSRANQSPLQNRVLIGAVTVLILIVGIVIAFQTNNSLPFVQRYTLHLQVANAEELTRGAEVHMGGSLIGFVSTVEAAHGPGGRPVADVTVQLDSSVAPLPRGSHFTIRLKGAIGTKFVDVTLGHDRRTWHSGATVPLADTGAAVDFDQVLNMFNAPTRVGVQRSTEGLGAALAGRGADINAAIGAFKPLTAVLAPVMRNLAAPATNLSGFIHSLGALNSTLAPVAGAQAQLFRGLAGTFSALASVARPSLQAAIADSPPTESAVVADAPAIGRLAASTATLFTRLGPGLATLPSATPIVADALEAGTRNLPGTAALDRRVTSLARTLAHYSANSAVRTALGTLTLTATRLQRPLNFLTPVQTRCDYITTTLHNLASTLSNNVGNGTVLRFVLVAVDDVTGGEAVPSQSVYRATGTAGGSHHAPLHSDAYPDTSSPGQPALCSAGNESFNANATQLGPATS